ncbi:MAG: Ig-like domain-containing protein, partial [Nitrosopumilaceae archaeon]
MTFLSTNLELKILLMIFILVMSMFTSSTYGQPASTFGYKLLPEKMLENTEGILQVYVLDGEKVVPKKIEQLVVTSSDSSIIQILKTENDPNEFITNVYIKAISAGSAKIALAAEGFLSTEFPILVYTSNNYPTQIFMKTTPNDFPIDGPQKGFLAVELATADGLPTKANDDFIVYISTPNDNVVGLQSDTLVIKKGEYFAIGEFSVKDPGDALIYAEIIGMKRVSNIIHVREPAEPLKVQLYVSPNTINSFTASYAYAIVQLQDADGKPVIAEKDIPITLQVTDPSAVSNTSNEFRAISVDSDPVIKKGTYWTYAKLAPRLGIEGTYGIGISTEGYLARGSSLNVVHEEAVLSDGPVELDTLPILATGNEELIGVLHLSETTLANANLEIGMESSEANSLIVQNTMIGKGTSTSLVFGKTGYVIPNDDEPLELYALTDESPAFPVTMEGPKEDNLGLVIEPLVPKILVNADFPLIAYILETADGDDTAASTTGEDDEDENGRIGITHFIDDTVLSFSANEYVTVEPKVISKGQPYALINIASDKIGSTTLSARGGGFSSNTNLDILSSEAALLHVVYPETFLPQTTNVIAIQVLNTQQAPVYAKEDIEIKLVSNDPQIAEAPESVIINKGSYYSFFEVKSNFEGTTELATLSTDLPLSKSNLKVSSVIPSIVIISKDFVDPNTSFDLILTTTYGNAPLSGINVVWNVQGAEIQNEMSVTDVNGQATITLLAKDPNKIDVQASVSSN